METRCPRMTWISPSSSLAHQLPKKLKENAIKNSSTFPQSVGWLVWSFTAVQVTSQTKKEKKKQKNNVRQQSNWGEKSCARVLQLLWTCVRGRWEGLDVINSKVDDGAGGARTFESLNVTCHLASFKSGRSFSSHARSLSFSYFRYPRGKFRSTPWCCCALTDDGTVTCYIKWGERRLYLERPRFFFFSLPCFSLGPRASFCLPFQIYLPPRLYQ